MSKNKATLNDCGCFSHGMKFIIDRNEEVWEEHLLVCSLVGWTEFRRAQIHLFNYHNKYFELHKGIKETVYLFNHHF